MLVGLRDPSNWQARGQPLLFDLMAAYGFGPFEKSRVVGLPKWGATDLFDIEARVPPHRRAITADTALRLAHFFGTSPEFWLNLQSLYEIRLARRTAGRAIRTLPTLKRPERAHA